MSRICSSKCTRLEARGPTRASREAGLWAVQDAGLQLWLTSVSGAELGGFPHHVSDSSFFLKFPPSLSLSPFIFDSSLVHFAPLLPRIMDRLALGNIYTFQVTAERLRPLRVQGAGESLETCSQTGMWGQKAVQKDYVNEHRRAV